MRTRIIVSIFSILFAILLVEGFLQLADPIGIMRLQDERIMTNTRMTARGGNLGYQLDAGIYDIRSHHKITILGDGSRLVINSNPSSPCTLAAIGDSLTFGMGVNDDITWVNLWAGHNDYNIINAGSTGYNAAEVANSMSYYPADGYVWLLYNNDNYATFDRARVPMADVPFRFALQLHLIEGSGDTKLDNDLMIESVQRITEANSIIFAFADNPLLEMLPDLDIVLIQRYTDRASIADAHPGVIGHQEIYNQMRPHFEEFAQQTCEDKLETLE